MVKQKKLSKKLFSIPNILIALYLIFNIAIMLFPLFFMFLNAFKSDEQITLAPFGFPKGFQDFANNVKDVFNGTITKNGTIRNSSLTPYLTMLKNTVILTIFPLLIMLVCSTLCAYGISRTKFRMKKWVMALLLLCQTVPYFGYMYPMFFELNFLGMIDHLWGVCLVYVAVSLPSCIILMLGFYQSFPKEIEEQAMIDGCNEVKKFLMIIVPMSAGMIATMAIINFMGFWNEFAIASLMLTSPKNRTLNMGVFLMQNDMKGITSKNYVFALLSMSAIPNLLFFTIFQKRIINGLTIGSLKG